MQQFFRNKTNGFFLGITNVSYYLSLATKTSGLVDAGFKELAKRWVPILDHAKDKGVQICYEIHPGKTVRWHYI